MSESQDSQNIGVAAKVDRYDTWGLHVSKCSLHDAEFRRLRIRNYKSKKDD